MMFTFYMGYLLIPFLGLFFTLFSFDFPVQRISEIIIILSCLLSVFVLVSRAVLPSRFSKFFLLFLAVLLLKAFQIFLNLDEIESLIISLMELKLPVLFFLSFALYGAGTARRSMEIGNGLLNLSYLFSLMIVLAFFLEFFSGGGRLSLLSESNYDGMIPLLGLLLSYNKYKKVTYKYLLVFALATLATLSKTGVIVFTIVVTYLMLERRHFFSCLFVFGLSLIAVYFVLEYRFAQLESLASIDRVVMWLAALELLQQLNTYQVLFGSTLGVPLIDGLTGMSWFVEFQTEKLGGSGIHPFNFHGFHLRFLFGYGLFCFVFFNLILFVCCIKSKVLRAWFLIYFLQGFSMGVFYLTTVSVFMIAVYFVLSREGNNAEI